MSNSELKKSLESNKNKNNNVTKNFMKNATIKKPTKKNNICIYTHLESVIHK